MRIATCIGSHDNNVQPVVRGGKWSITKRLSVTLSYNLQTRVSLWSLPADVESISLSLTHVQVYTTMRNKMPCHSTQTLVHTAIQVWYVAKLGYLC